MWLNQKFSFSSLKLQLDIFHKKSNTRTLTNSTNILCYYHLAIISIKLFINHFIPKILCLFTFVVEINLYLCFKLESFYYYQIFYCFISYTINKLILKNLPINCLKAIFLMTNNTSQLHIIVISMSASVNKTHLKNT